MRKSAAISIAHALNGISHYVDYMPSNVYNRLLDVTNQRMGYSDSFEPSFRYCPSEDNSDMGFSDPLKVISKDFQVYRLSLTNDAEYFFRTEHYVWAIETFYFAVRYLSLFDDWTKILEDPYEKKDAYLTYLATTWSGYSEDVFDDILYHAVQIERYVLNMPFELEKDKQSVISTDKYLSQILSVIRTDLGEPPENIFKKMLPSVLQEIFCIEGADFLPECEHSLTFVYIGSAKIGCYYMWRKSHSFLQSALLEAMDIAIAVISNCHYDIESHFLTEDGSSYFYATIFTEDAESYYFSPFFLMASSIFSSLYSYWETEYILPASQ